MRETRVAFDHQPGHRIMDVRSGQVPALRLLHASLYNGGCFEGQNRSLVYIDWSGGVVPYPLCIGIVQRCPDVCRALFPLNATDPKGDPYFKTPGRVCQTSRTGVIPMHVSKLRSHSEDSY